MNIDQIVTPTLLLVSSCCGKGYREAQKLIIILQNNGLRYKLVNAKQINTQKIFDRMGVVPEKREPYLYIDDILFRASEINNINFINKLVEDLKKLKEVRSKKCEELSRSK